MTASEARAYMQRMTTDSRGYNSQFGGARWQDPCHIATDTFRQGVISKLSREPIYDDSVGVGEGPYSGVALVEIYLTEPLPDTQWFYGIFTVDDFGIWYSDGASIDLPVTRQRVIPWRYVKGLVVHELTV